MDIWGPWLELIRTVVTALAADAGLGVGFGIVVATVLLRSIVLPLAWPIAYRACIRQKKLAKLQPELRAVQDKFRDQPDVYLRKLAELYKAREIAMVDAKSLLGALVQMPLFLGMFQALRTIGDGARFLWIPNLLRPDIALAMIAGLATALMMAMLDGIQNKIDPGKPLDKDIYALAPEELKDVPKAPGSLDESLKALERDHAFLLKGDVFTSEVIQTWIDYKRENEVDALRLRPHPYEFALYFDN